MIFGVTPVWVVQDVDSGLFLYPSDDGDVGFTALLRDAGRFDNAESAIDTARFHLGDRFVVTKFYEEMRIS